MLLRKYWRPRERGIILRGPLRTPLVGAHPKVPLGEVAVEAEDLVARGEGVAHMADVEHLSDALPPPPLVGSGHVHVSMVVSPQQAHLPPYPLINRCLMRRLRARNSSLHELQWAFSVPR